MQIVRLVLVIALSWLTNLATAQLGGQRSYDFLNLPIGARVSGLGGVVISATDEDVNLFLSNPSLLSDNNHNHISWSHLSYYADVKYNAFAYAYDFDKLGTMAIGVQRMGYGEFDRYDASDNYLGQFSASETALVVSKSHQVSLFTMGLSAKFVTSNLDNVNSSALAFDLGGSFFHPQHELVASLLFKNFGFVLSDYSATSKDKLPTDVQLGFTYKPEHMPFRLSTTIYNLSNSEGAYHDPSLSSQKPTWLDQAFRHVNLGVEIVFSENFNIRTGYNHLIRKELTLEERSGMSGISLGMMARIKAFEFSYTWSTYHVAGGRSYFTITSDLNRIFNKKSLL